MPRQQKIRILIIFSYFPLPAWCRTKKSKDLATARSPFFHSTPSWTTEGKLLPLESSCFPPRILIIPSHRMTPEFFFFVFGALVVLCGFLQYVIRQRNQVSLPELLGSTA